MVKERPYGSPFIALYADGDHQAVVEQVASRRLERPARRLRVGRVPEHGVRILRQQRGQIPFRPVEPADQLPVITHALGDAELERAVGVADRLVGHIVVGRIGGTLVSQTVMVRSSAAVDDAVGTRIDGLDRRVG